MGVYFIADLALAFDDYGAAAHFKTHLNHAFARRPPW